MRNRSAIWIFTVLLFLACLYQLSFSWVVRSFEDEVKQEAIAECDTVLYNILENGVGYVVDDTLTYENHIVIDTIIENDDTLFVESITEKTKIKSIARFEQVILDNNRDEKIFLNTLSYQSCKDQELGLGLDLQGGMSVTLEVAIYDLVRNLAGNSRQLSFQEPFLAALKSYKANEDFKDASGNDFISLFAKHHEALYPGERMKWFNVTNKEEFEIEWTNNEIIEKLKVLSKDCIENTQRIIESRVNKFGVSQPNIQKQPISGRLLIELPGARDKNLIRKLLQSTASLEFWDGAHKDWRNDFLSLDSKVTVQDFEEDSVENQFITISEDSLATLSEDEKLVYQIQKEQNDSLLAEKLIEAKTQDSLRLSSGKILDGNMWFIQGGTNPHIGYAEEKDTSKVNAILNSEVGKTQFKSKDVKFLWNTETTDYQNTKVFSLIAIEVPRDGKPKLNGEDILDAGQSYDQDGPTVSLMFKSQAALDWEKWTGEKLNKMIAIVLDDQIYSAPYIRAKISGGSTEISGNFDIQEAQELAKILKAGSLPAPAVIVDEAIVGPSLGEENINSGLWSFVLAFGLVLFYMIFYYKKAGWVANVALLANIFFIVGTLASLGAALTLPGIAGLVLTIGMSVDANVLIYERIKEELANGKGIKLAVSDGYKHAYSAIIDANVTSLLTAVVLAYFGSGPIQGFATTLIIGVFTSLFSALFITRLIFSYMMDNKKELAFSRTFTKNLFKGTTITFFKKRKIFYVISLLIVAGGAVSLFNRGLDKGVEFTGGRTYRVEFSQQVDRLSMKEAITSRSVNEDGTTVSPELKTVDNAYNLEITTKYLYQDTDNKKIEKIDSVLVGAFNDLGYSNNEDGESSNGDWFKINSSRSVDKQISAELIQNSLFAIILSLFIIFIYIAFRFKKWQFGVGALIAMFHDVLVVLGLFSLLYNFVPFSMEIDQAFIAAILTVVGYSINDTVVVFDRIREYSILHKKSSTESIIDTALNSTLSRTINTSLSTFLVLLTIFIFGGESIKGFSFALMVGVVVGTYSSLFIATPSVVDLSKKKITA
ncbi:MAG: protein translocase subunit SecDF [Flavobacteriales bacterium]|nr:protein translocase subunit SecDF [Flavobacteriales bacterium]